MTSAWARHIEADSERNLRISASRTCSTSVAGFATGLTRLSLIASTLQPLSTAAATDCRVSSRSEEHTSELQSLMRISYAVFCLQKKNKPNTERDNNINH